MSRIHAHQRNYVKHRHGLCSWRHEHEDVALTCESPDVVGTGLCIDHLRTADVVVFEGRVIVGGSA